MIHQPSPPHLLCGLLIWVCGLAILHCETVNAAQEQTYPNYPASPVLPPDGHPRLYLRPETIEFYAGLIGDPRFAGWANSVNRNSLARLNEVFPTGSSPEYDPALHERMEACALRYILEGNQEMGQRAVSWLVRILPEITFPGEQDITRKMGATIHTAAIVYDWCYNLLSAEDKPLIIKHIKRIAGQMEVGYPPVHGGSLVGHIGESEIFRDQLSAGVAVYDEDPEIYQLAAGRFFAELLPGREFFYPSHWHHQGSNYGRYRLAWELWAAVIFKTMTGREVFSQHQTRLARTWLYIKRPDGHTLADGDVPGFPPQNNARYRPDWGLFHVNLLTTFLSGDPVLAGEIADTIRQYDTLAQGYAFTESLAYFLFARPDLETAPLETLPLAKNFPEPAGRMLVRTGWDMSDDSRDLILCI